MQSENIWESKYFRLLRGKIFRVDPGSVSSTDIRKTLAPASQGWESCSSFLFRQKVLEIFLCKYFSPTSTNSSCSGRSRQFPKSEDSDWLSIWAIWFQPWIPHLQPGRFSVQPRQGLPSWIRQTRSVQQKPEPDLLPVPQQQPSPACPEC